MDQVIASTPNQLMAGFQALAAAILSYFLQALYGKRLIRLFIEIQSYRRVPGTKRCLKVLGHTRRNRSFWNKQIKIRMDSIRIRIVIKLCIQIMIAFCHGMICRMSVGILYCHCGLGIGFVLIRKEGLPIGNTIYFEQVVGTIRNRFSDMRNAYDLIVFIQFISSVAFFCGCA